MHNRKKRECDTSIRIVRGSGIKHNAQYTFKSISWIETNEIERSLISLCNHCMKTSSGLTRRKPVYWWTESIAELWNECQHKRIIYTRRRARSNNEPEIAKVKRLFKEAKRRLSLEIEKQKRQNGRT